MKKGNCVSFVVACAGCLLSITQSRAERVPAALTGNSIVLSWTEFLSERNGIGWIRTRTNNFSANVYVSSQQRIFSALQDSVVRATGQPPNGVTVKDISGTDENTLHWHFQDGAIIADTSFGLNGVRRLVVHSSDDFKTCSIDVIHAKELGTKQIRENTIWRTVEIKVSFASCVIQSGNIFAK